MVVVSDRGILDDVSLSEPVIFSFCVVGVSEWTTAAWVVGDTDVPVASSYNETNISLILKLTIIINTILKLCITLNSNSLVHSTVGLCT